MIGGSYSVINDNNANNDSDSHCNIRNSISNKTTMMILMFVATMMMMVTKMITMITATITIVKTNYHHDHFCHTNDI